MATKIEKIKQFRIIARTGAPLFAFNLVKALGR